jgi:hypothetical protein
MRTFKAFINEGIAWQTSLSKQIFDFPRASIKDLTIPLSSSIFKRIWPDTIRSTAFHLTDYDGLENLKRIQNSKKSISAFYNMKSRQIGDGIRTYGGYVAEIEGDVLVAGPRDVATMPDKGGRRYIVWQTIKNGPTDYPPGMGGGRGVNKIEKDLEKMLSGLVDKYDKYLSDFKFKVDPVLAWPMIRKGITTSGSNSGKVLHKAIADYLDGMEKVMKKHSKILHSIFTDYTKSRTLKTDPDSGDTSDWDELVINNFKIKKIHVGEEFAEDFEDDTDIMGIPIMVWNDHEKLSSHLSAISKEGR